MPIEGVGMRNTVTVTYSYCYLYAHDCYCDRCSRVTGLVPVHNLFVTGDRYITVFESGMLPKVL